MNNEQFLLFPQCFLPFRELSTIFVNLKLYSAISFTLEESKICCSGKGEAFAPTCHTLAFFSTMYYNLQR